MVEYQQLGFNLIFDQVVHHDYFPNVKYLDCFRVSISIHNTGVKVFYIIFASFSFSSCICPFKI